MELAIKERVQKHDNGYDSEKCMVIYVAYCLCKASVRELPLCRELPSSGKLENIYLIPVYFTAVFPKYVFKLS